jgi:predicted glycosyltransferase
MKLIKSIILSLFPIFGMSQSSLTLSICECSTSEVNEIIQIAIFYGYKFEDHLIKEVGVSDYISATRRSEPSPLTIIVKLVIVNNQSGVNKKYLHQDWKDLKVILISIIENTILEIVSLI